MSTVLTVLRPIVVVTIAGAFVTLGLFQIQAVLVAMIVGVGVGGGGGLGW